MSHLWIVQRKYGDDWSNGYLYGFVSFLPTSRNVRLEGSTLYAECETVWGQWKQSSLDINKHLGNNDGEFDTYGRGAYDCALPGWWRLEGTVLVFKLRRDNRSYTGELRLDLAKHVSNENGKLTWWAG